MRSKRKTTLPVPPVGLASDTPFAPAPTPLPAAPPLQRPRVANGRTGPTLLTSTAVREHTKFTLEGERGYYFVQVEAFVDDVAFTLEQLEAQIAEKNETIDRLIADKQQLEITLNVFKVRGRPVEGEDGSLLTESQLDDGSVAAAGRLLELEAEITAARAEIDRLQAQMATMKSDADVEYAVTEAVEAALAAERAARRQARTAERVAVVEATGEASEQIWDAVRDVVAAEFESRLYASEHEAARLRAELIIAQGGTPADTPAGDADPDGKSPLDAAIELATANAVEQERARATAELAEQTAALSAELLAAQDRLADERRAGYDEGFAAGRTEGLASSGDDAVRDALAAAAADHARHLEDAVAGRIASELAAQTARLERDYDTRLRTAVAEHIAAIGDVPRLIDVLRRATDQAQVQKDAVDVVIAELRAEVRTTRDVTVGVAAAADSAALYVRDAEVRAESFARDVETHLRTAGEEVVRRAAGAEDAARRAAQQAITEVTGQVETAQQILEDAFHETSTALTATTTEARAVARAARDDALAAAEEAKTVAKTAKQEIAAAARETRTAARDAVAEVRRTRTTTERAVKDATAAAARQAVEATATPLLAKVRVTELQRDTAIAERDAAVESRDRAVAASEQLTATVLNGASARAATAGRLAAAGAPTGLPVPGAPLEETPGWVDEVIDAAAKVSAVTPSRPRARRTPGAAQAKPKAGAKAAPAKPKTKASAR